MPFIDDYSRTKCWNDLQLCIEATLTDSIGVWTWYIRDTHPHIFGQMEKVSDATKRLEVLGNVFSGILLMSLLDQLARLLSVKGEWTTVAVL